MTVRTTSEPAIRVRNLEQSCTGVQAESAPDTASLSRRRVTEERSRDGEITFADHTRRFFYTQRYGMAPVVGRLIGYLAICDPREQSISELAESLLASRSAIANALVHLETLGLVRRSRAAGERMDRVRIDLSVSNAMGFDMSEYQQQGALAGEGLDLLADAPPERRAILLEWAAFTDFLVQRLPVLEREWTERREELRASGEFSRPPDHERGDQEQ
ncbi:MAG TPA: hypothetical protein VMU49_06915 [Candidatus Acidoferrales bacterium]|nr:hypothetical protein [Candidatus Acidoferrales bacterium]